MPIVSDAKNGESSRIAANATNGNNLKCSSPAEIFSIATALTLLFSSELNEKQLNTLINLFGLLQAGLSAVVTQMQICAGEEVEPPID